MIHAWTLCVYLGAKKALYKYSSFPFSVILPACWFWRLKIQWTGGWYITRRNSVIRYKRVSAPQQRAPYVLAESRMHALKMTVTDVALFDCQWRVDHHFVSSYDSHSKQFLISEKINVISYFGNLSSCSRWLRPITNAKLRQSVVSQNWRCLTWARANTVTCSTAVRFDTAFRTSLATPTQDDVTADCRSSNYGLSVNARAVMRAASLAPLYFYSRCSVAFSASSRLFKRLMYFRSTDGDALTEIIWLESSPSNHRRYTELQDWTHKWKKFSPPKRKHKFSYHTYIWRSRRVDSYCSVAYIRYF